MLDWIALLGKVGYIVSGLATTAKSIEQIAENKQIRNQMPGLATEIRELRKKLDGLGETLEELVKEAQAAEEATTKRVTDLEKLTDQRQRSADERFGGIEKRLSFLSRSTYVVAGFAGASVVYVVLRLFGVLAR